MGEEDFNEPLNGIKEGNGYLQRHLPVLPWYSVPDKPFPRRKHKCMKCEEIQKQSINSQVQAVFPEKKLQAETPVESNQISLLNQESLSGGKAVENNVSVSDSHPVSRSWSDLLKSSGTSSAVVPPCKSTLPSACEIISDDLNKVLSSVKLNSEKKHSVLLQPRGLINTGNVCFMNVILQVLVFCPPFYNLLDEIGKRMAHSFVNDTSLINALISFIREFSVIDQAVLNGNSQIKKQNMEEFGAPFIPEYVYVAMRGNKLFDSMGRGHQEDAEEFLGLLLDALHEEFIDKMKSNHSTSDVYLSNRMNRTDSSATNSSEYSQDKNDNEWIEVGPKQKTSIMRSANVSESPLTSIFTGNFRSILRVAGMKPSITLEPYRSLQLDIEPLHIGSIEEALQNITQSEVLNGDWHSSLGEKLKATKQVFIETLPQVLILHLKRFVYDNVGGTQKSYKNVHYPLQFEIPPTVMSPHRRFEKNIKFILFAGKLYLALLFILTFVAVVYHHGMSASGGHYTVDLLRQDMQSWIRVDDTHISHILSEHVVPSSVESPSRFAYLLFYLRS
ncbi:hypothetical protein PORY_002094 [Pneumocystis oryctolagi]|uniref:Uncharacterized protein n=1 Tax=Pneumocystis oryctolagi TaxID=42067 RepID=A0ACB7CH02_9ASCO|nr:hypothetical protein PORY_002094 [Pneumocystis oryctolagi]